MSPKTSPGLSSLLEPYPPLIRLLELWETRASNNRPMPARHDLDTLTLRDWLGHIHLVEVTDGQYHYRIYGTSIGRLFGRDLQSRAIGELPEPERSEATLDYNCVVQSKRPHFVERERNVTDRSDIMPRPRLVGKLCLPLSEDGANVTQILAAIYPRQE